MTNNEFNDRMKDHPLLEEAYELFKCFEFFIDRVSNFSEGEIETFRIRLNNYDIKATLSSLGKKLSREEKVIMRPYIASLQVHLRQFQTFYKSYDFLKKRRKCKCILLAYINLSRMIFEYDKIKAFVQNSSSKKILLCVGMIDLDIDDLIMVNEEILSIQEASLKNDEYLVLPVHGCTFDAFRAKLEKLEISNIHIAGHGRSDRICFADANVTYRKFKNLFEKLNNEKEFNLDLLFLNCCYTFDFVKKQKVDFVDNTICFKGGLPADQAIDVSTYYYSYLFDHYGEKEAWLMTCKSTNTDDYFILS